MDRHVSAGLLNTGVIMRSPSTTEYSMSVISAARSMFLPSHDVFSRLL